MIPVKFRCQGLWRSAVYSTNDSGVQISDKREALRLHQLDFETDPSWDRGAGVLSFAASDLHVWLEGFRAAA